MKTSERIPKALVVIIIVGTGVLYNMKHNHFAMHRFSEMTTTFYSPQVKSDTIEKKENKLYMYSKSIINSSIQYIISNL